MGETTMSVLEKLKKLEAEAKDLRSTAKKEAMAAVKAAVADLNSLGFNYEIVENTGDGYRDVPLKKRGPKAGKTGIKRHRDPNKPCSVCNFVTEPAHDGRVHRAQGDAKKPFTAKELEELGLKKK